jgi:hypothetical protein
MVNGGRDLPLLGTTVGARRGCCSGFLPPFPVAAGTTSLQKIIIFGMNSDEDKIYTKFVAFDEVYNFVGQTFFI